MSHQAPAHRQPENKYRHSANTHRHPGVTGLWIVGMVVLCATGPWASAQPSATEATGETTATGGSNLYREQSIYIPYTKLREVFEKQGRGVFLPYEEFNELWKAAREARRPPDVPAPPVQAMIQEASHEATISGDVMQVRATLRIELLTKGWHTVPLRLNDAAISQATLGDEPARLTFDPQQGHSLIVQKTDDTPSVIELRLVYAKTYGKAPGRNSVGFDAPQTPVSRWTIEVPEAGAKIQIEPLIAASEEPTAATGTAGDTAKTVLKAFVGAAPRVTIHWTAKAEGATGLEALVSVKTEQNARIEEGVMRTQTLLHYEISRASLEELKISVPGDQKITNVYDVNVRQWTVETQDDRQVISVQLFEPASAGQRILVDLERFLSDDDLGDVRLPVVQALDVGRQQGALVVGLGAGLRGEVTTQESVIQVDAGDLPEWLSKQSWIYAYRYSTLPYIVALAVEKVQPTITTRALAAIEFQPDRIAIDFTVIYTIERAGVFHLDLMVPEEWSSVSFQGIAMEGVEPIALDNHFRDKENPEHYVVNLSRKAMGKVGLRLRVHKMLEDANLRTPTGEVSLLDVALPRVWPEGVESRQGQVIVSAPESLRVNPKTVAGLRAVSFDEALGPWPANVRPNAGAMRPVLAYAFADEDVSLQLAAERRKPQVTIRQLLVADVEPGVIKYRIEFHYSILYSGVQELRIDVPKAYAADIRSSTGTMRDKPMDPQPEDVGEDDVAWQFTSGSEILGDGMIELKWEVPLEDLDVGKSVEVAVPHLKPRGVDRAWGQIVLTKAESIDLREQEGVEGIRPIDPQHDLHAGTRVANAARAFEFHDEAWTLPIKITRYQLQEIKPTSIERAWVQMVLTRGDEISVRALYRVRSAQQRLELTFPGTISFDSQPVRINGQPVPLERGDKQDYFIPLIGLTAETPFLLDLRYIVTDAGRSLACPQFPADPAAQKVYLSAYVPKEWDYLGATGPWTEELRWVNTPLDNQPVPVRSQGELENWVREGVPCDPAAIPSFQTDGRMLLFSTIPFAEERAATLHLILLDRDWMSLLLLGPVIIGGLVLLRARFAWRWIALGLLVVALILCGVFVPTFSQQIMDGKLQAAVLLVLVLWAMHYFGWVRPRDPQLVALREAKQQARLALIQARTETIEARGRGAQPPPPEAKSDKVNDRKEDTKGGSSDA